MHLLFLKSARNVCMFMLKNDFKREVGPVFFKNNYLLILLDVTTQQGRSLEPSVGTLLRHFLTQF